jgi:hypothetical protein
MRSIALLLEVVGKSLDSLVELSGVLGYTVLHFVLDVETANEVVVLCGCNTGTSAFLGIARGTFFR